MSLHDICSQKDKVIHALDTIEKIRKFVIINNMICIISLQETIKEKWGMINIFLAQLEKLLSQNIEKTNIYLIPHIKDLIDFLNKNIKNKKHTPETFYLFFRNFFKRKLLTENINLLKLIISDNNLCKKSFENY
mgnify:CR=1 FL=1|jgi:hypothetical protein